MFPNQRPFQQPVTVPVGAPQPQQQGRPPRPPVAQSKQEDPQKIGAAAQEGRETPAGSDVHVADLQPADICSLSLQQQQQDGGHFSGYDPFQGLVNGQHVVQPRDPMQQAAMHASSSGAHQQAQLSGGGGAAPTDPRRQRSASPAPAQQHPAPAGQLPSDPHHPPQPSQPQQATVQPGGGCPVLTDPRQQRSISPAPEQQLPADPRQPRHVSQGTAQVPCTLPTGPRGHSGSCATAPAQFMQPCSVCPAAMQQLPASPCQQQGGPMHLGGSAPASNPQQLKAGTPSSQLSQLPVEPQQQQQQQSSNPPPLHMPPGSAASPMKRAAEKGTYLPAPITLRPPTAQPPQNPAASSLPRPITLMPPNLVAPVASSPAADQGLLTHQPGLPPQVSGYSQTAQWPQQQPQENTHAAGAALQKPITLKPPAGAKPKDSQQRGKQPAPFKAHTFEYKR